MAMNKVQVWANVDGQQVLVGERKTPRAYDWAVVVRGADGSLGVASYHRSRQLAQAAIDTAWQVRRRMSEGATAEVYSTLVVPVAERARVRCEGVVAKVGARGWVRGTRCLKDAGEGGTLRCAVHAAQDVARAWTEIREQQEAHSAAEQAKWDARHAEEYTAATCPVVDGRCRVHGAAK